MYTYYIVYYIYSVMCGTCSRYKRLVRLFSPKGKSTIRSLYTFVSGVGGRAAALKYARHCNTILALKATFADMSRACYVHTAFALLSHSWFWLSLQVPYNNLSQNLCIPSRSFVTFLRPFCCCSPASNGFPKPQDSQNFQCNNLCQHSARYCEMSS